MALTEMPVCACSKGTAVPFSLAPSVSAGDATMKGPLDHMGATAKRENTNFSYEVLFPFFYTFKSGEKKKKKKDAILCQGSGQPEPALKLITMALDELLKAAGTVLLYILLEKRILPWAGWR